MAAKFFIGLIIIFSSWLIILPVYAQTDSSCQWTYSTNNDTGICQRIFGNNGKKWQIGTRCNPNTKGAYNNTCCCPIKTSPKYLIIGILVVVFSLVTGYFIIVKNNQEN